MGRKPAEHGPERYDKLEVRGRVRTDTAILIPPA
jgi:hypothetical protein